MYKDDPTQYYFWSRDLWQWALDTIRHPSLATSFVWDSRKLFKFDGEVFVRFIHEPWTADRFWEVQVGSQFY
jgi:hypothetical protein